MNSNTYTTITPMKSAVRKIATAQRVVVREVFTSDGTLHGYRLVSSRSYDNRLTSLYVYAAGRSFDIGQWMPISTLKEINSSKGYRVSVER